MILQPGQGPTENSTGKVFMPSMLQEMAASLEQQCLPKHLGAAELSQGQACTASTLKCAELDLLRAEPGKVALELGVSKGSQLSAS